MSSGNSNLPNKESGPEKSRTFGAQNLSGVLSGLLKPMSDKDSGFLSRIKSDWHLIAGDKVAVHTRPVKVTRLRGKNGGALLHLEAEEGFAAELPYMEPLLTEKIAVYFGYRAVSGIRFTQVAAKSKKQKIKARELTPEEKSAVAGAVEGIGDENLKDALARLGAAVTEKN